MIIISGASRGIGLYLMQQFLSENKEVVGLYNNTEPTLNKELMYKVDITNPQQIGDLLKIIDNKIENIVLINCAGANYNAFAHKADPLIWAELININLMGSFNMIHTFLPIMREQNYGRIINFSSVLAQIGLPGTSAYAASKAGLWGMTKVISAENATKGITINNLNLGYFNIGMVVDEVPETIQNQILERIPTKQFGHPNEIFLAVKYLIDSSYTTGTSIDINGGLY